MNENGSIVGYAVSVRPRNSEHEDVIIGTGPAGYAAAQGVIARGGHPFVIDFGPSPSPGLTAIQKISTFAMKGEVDRVSVFNYPNSLVHSEGGIQLPLSSARGGLSNIWGAGILNRGHEEMPEIEAVYPEIEQAYKSLLALMPNVGVNDRTSDRFPFLGESNPAPQSSRFKDFIASAQSVSNDVLFGYPRLALDITENQCTRCGSCLHGCPNNLFFSAARGFEQLEKSGKCTLLSGPVLSITSGGFGVELVTPNGVIRCGRVYVASGPIATPSLLQRSRLAPARIVVKDSAVFYSAFLNLNKIDGTESSYTAAHGVAYAERAGSEDFQMAFYESNPEYAERLSAILPVVGRFVRIPNFVTNRLNATIGFIDSSVSGTLNLQYSGNRTWITRKEPPEIKKAVRAVIKRTNAVTRRYGLFAIPSVVFVPPVGTGYHSGASMPMGGEGVGLSGLLTNTKNVYVVDASVLPKVWAGSHTFTAMANAYRIALGNH